MTKGVVLAGGTGSRLWPLTRVTNKHLLPVGRKPMIFYPIMKMLEVGIEDILIVAGTEHAGSIFSLLGSGKDFNCRFTYKVQDQAGGIAEALGLAEDYKKNDNILVILGDNIFEDSLSGYPLNCDGATLFLKKVEDPKRFGVVALDPDTKRIIDIEEKPENPASDLAVTGIYHYDNSVFDVIHDLKVSDRGEMEITDVNKYYIEQERVEYHILDGWWTDAGTFKSLEQANNLIGKKS